MPLLWSVVAVADGVSWAAAKRSTSTSSASSGFTVTGVTVIGGTAAGDALGGTAPVALGSVGAGEGAGVLLAEGTVAVGSLSGLEAGS